MPDYRSNKQDALNEFLLQGMRSGGAQGNALVELIGKARAAEQARSSDARAAEELFNKYGGRVGVKQGESAFTPRDNTASGRAIAQRRLESAALAKNYGEQTRGIKEQQGYLDQIGPLMADPTNVDDQQLRRQLALAVNKGVLSDTDVEDALPGDIAQTTTKAFNFIQPVLSPLGIKKRPIFSKGTLEGIRKLVQGKTQTLQSQLDEAGKQLDEVAPYLAPTLHETDPQGLVTLTRGIKGPRERQQTRLNTTPGGRPKTVQRLDPKTGQTHSYTFNPTTGEYE